MKSTKELSFDLDTDSSGAVSISEDSDWLPGAYDNEATAKLALGGYLLKGYKYLWSVSNKVWSVNGEDRLITAEDLNSANL